MRVKVTFFPTRSLCLNQQRKRMKNIEDGEKMDMISELPDELLIKVLSLLPTKDAVSTMILSKRWNFLWMWLSKLEYDYSYYSVAKRQMLRHFIDSTLPLHRAPVIESFRLKFDYGPDGSIKPEDIQRWTLVAISLSVGELSLNLSSLAAYGTTLPSSLYTCKSIVILELVGEIFVDVPHMARLPSLKTFYLRYVTYSHQNALDKLLSSSPVLEDLVIERYQMDNLRKLSIIVKSLLRLILRMINPCPLDGLEINAPSLKYLSVTDYRDEIDSDNDTTDAQYTYYFEDMPKLEEANLDLKYQDIREFVSAIISVKRLQLCLRVSFVKPLYHVNINFKQLEHLKLCSCDLNWPLVLVTLLRDSPNLRHLEIFRNDVHEHNENPYWDGILCNLPPFCCENTLQTFKWIGIDGTKKEMDVAKYFLKNCHSLQTVTIFFQSSLTLKIKELRQSFRGPKTCQLIIC